MSFLDQSLYLIGKGKLFMWTVVSLKYDNFESTFLKCRFLQFLIICFPIFNIEESDDLHLN